MYLFHTWIPISCGDERGDNVVAPVFVATVLLGCDAGCLVGGADGAVLDGVVAAVLGADG